MTLVHLIWGKYNMIHCAFSNDGVSSKWVHLSSDVFLSFVLWCPRLVWKFAWHCQSALLISIIFYWLYESWKCYLRSIFMAITCFLTFTRPVEVLSSCRWPCEGFAPFRLGLLLGSVVTVSCHRGNYHFCMSPGIVVSALPTTTYSSDEVTFDLLVTCWGHSPIRNVGTCR